jgi:hypothetical protein
MPPGIATVVNRLDTLRGPKPLPVPALEVPFHDALGRAQDLTNLGLADPCAPEHPERLVRELRIFEPDLH